MKKLLIVFILVMLTACNSKDTNSSEPEKDVQFIIVELLNFSIETYYKDSKYEISYTTENNAYKAEITNIETGELVANYSERPSIEIEKAKTGEIGTYDTVVSQSFETSDEVPNIEVWIGVNISVSDEGRVVNFLEGHWLSIAENELGFYLEPIGIFDNTRGYPSKRMVIHSVSIIRNEEAEKLFIFETEAYSKVVAFDVLEERK